MVVTTRDDGNSDIERKRLAGVARFEGSPLPSCLPPYIDATDLQLCRHGNRVSGQEVSAMGVSISCHGSGFGGIEWWTDGQGVVAL